MADERKLCHSLFASLLFAPVIGVGIGLAMVVFSRSGSAPNDPGIAGQAAGHSNELIVLFVCLLIVIAHGGHCRLAYGPVRDLRLPGHVPAKAVDLFDAAPGRRVKTHWDRAATHSWQRAGGWGGVRDYVLSCAVTFINMSYFEQPSIVTRLFFFRGELVPAWQPSGLTLPRKRMAPSADDSLRRSKSPPIVYLRARSDTTGFWSGKGGGVC